MMTCSTIDSGFEIYECPNCLKSHIICYTCKSRFCNSCGIKYAKIRAANISENTLSIKHRHIVFTIDERLRDYFLRDRSLLNVLFDLAKETLLYAFDQMNGKEHTFKPGFILTLHTFGRSLNFNPYIHCLATEGGMDEDNHYKSIKYFHYETLRKSFMKQLLDRIKAYYADNPTYLYKIRKLINQIYQEKKNGFYIHAPKMKIKYGKDSVISYIIRYTGRPVMASLRIVRYDNKTKMIHYYYEDHETKDKELIMMTAAKIDEEGIYDVQLASLEEDRHYIDMKYTSCGYEEKILVWCYAEEADFLINEGDQNRLLGNVLNVMRIHSLENLIS